MSHTDIVSPRADGPPDLHEYVAEICDALDRSGASVDSFNASWDGDTTGWLVRFEALTRTGSLVWVGGIRGAGGDMRLLNGTVPPWPEVPYAVELGRRLATVYGVQFVFDRGDGPVGTSALVASGGGPCESMVQTGRNEQAEVVFQHLVAPPGWSGGWHTHAGVVFVTVAEGVLTYYHEHDPCQGETFSKGEGFAEEAHGYDVHIARNEGSTDLELYTMTVVHKGDALRKDQPAPPGACF
jgi:quercetin dioxygenase-like cupin family protein